jgi:hypothetical protein
VVLLGIVWDPLAVASDPGVRRFAPMVPGRAPMNLDLPKAAAAGGGPKAGGRGGPKAGGPKADPLPPPAGPPVGGPVGRPGPKGGDKGKGKGDGKGKAPTRTLID